MATKLTKIIPGAAKPDDVKPNNPVQQEARRSMKNTEHNKVVDAYNPYYNYFDERYNLRVPKGKKKKAKPPPVNINERVTAKPPKEPVHAEPPKEPVIAETVTKDLATAEAPTKELATAEPPSKEPRPKSLNKETKRKKQQSAKKKDTKKKEVTKKKPKSAPKSKSESKKSGEQPQLPIVAAAVKQEEKKEDEIDVKDKGEAKKPAPEKPTPEQKVLPAVEPVTVPAPVQDKDVQTAQHLSSKEASLALAESNINIDERSTFLTIHEGEEEGEDEDEDGDEDDDEDDDKEDAKGGNAKVSEDHSDEKAYLSVESRKSKDATENANKKSAYFAVNTAKGKVTQRKASVPGNIRGKSNEGNNYFSITSGNPRSTDKQNSAYFNIASASGKGKAAASHGTNNENDYFSRNDTKGASVSGAKA